MTKATDYAQQIVDLYANLQQQIFSLLINALKTSKFKEIDASNVMQWQLEQLSKAGMLTKQVIAIVAKANGKSSKYVEQMCQQLGLQAINQTQNEIAKNTTHAGNITPESDQLIKSYINQTNNYLFNSVNESLLSRNIQNNAAARVFRDIVTKSTLEVTTGLKSHEKAVADNTYRWVQNGIPTKLADKAGRGWSIDSYSRLVVENTSNRVFNDLRNKTMNSNDLTLATMSWHPCARPACAPIQGHIVNIIPTSDPRYNGKYDSIYNHDYGDPGGFQGINCKHILTPFDPDVNIFHKDPNLPTPDQAVKQGQVQQKQRALERAIRQQKAKLWAASKFGDSSTASSCKTTIANQQSKLRDLVNSHDYLVRDYSREQTRR